MFPPFPTLLLPPPPVIDPTTADTVRIRRIVAETSGASGARRPVYSGWSASIPCLIKGMRAIDTTAPQMLEREVVTYQVTFADYPDLGVRDQLSWDSLGKILNVTGVMPVGDPTVRTWTVFAEEHP